MAQHPTAYARTATGVRGGSPDAPVRVRIYEDLQCPYCALLHLRLQAPLKEWVAGGRVQVEHVVTDKLARGNPASFSAVAGSVAMAVAEYDVERFGAVLEALYYRIGSPADLEDLLATARDAGARLPAEAAGRIRAGDFHPRLGAALDAALDRGVVSVPHVDVDGEHVEGADDMVELGSMITELVEALELVHA